MGASQPPRSPVGVCFVGRSRSGSFQIRGEQIAATRANWSATLDPRSIDWDAVDVVCLVKHPRPAVIRAARRRGKTVVYDVVDAWRQPVDGLRYTTPEAIRAYFAAKWRPLGIRHFIFANRRMHADLARLVPQATAIYHHYRPGLAVQPIRPEARVVGYEGNPAYLGHWRATIEAICARSGLEFVVNPPDWSIVDIGFAARGGVHDSPLANLYKSNVKLANFHGSGTPCVVSAQDVSYQETDTGAVRFFRTAAELDAQIDALRDVETRRRIQACLLRTQEMFSIDRIAGEFEQFFQIARAIDTGRSGAPADPGGALRLNLGCGDKHLPGYLNVDAAPNRKGVAPDLLMDLRHLALPDRSADEILAVHVIEHFYHWEVRDVLAEWRRVLRPGGRIVLECPNLLHAARELIAAPERAARPDKAGQMSMWVFYGDPAWQDPLMCHRWGYTPASLQSLLREAGFVQVTQEPAQFKKKDPRDMRVTGVRPADR